MNLPNLPWGIYDRENDRPQAQRPDLPPPKTVVLAGVDERKAVIEERGMNNFEG